MLTQKLAQHYKWDNVSLFDVAEDINELSLLQQDQGSDKDYVLQADFNQPANKGLLGKVVREKRRIYERDVDKAEEFIRGHPLTKSELIIPIFSKMYEPKRIFWLLNIEDSQSNFLLIEEIKELEEIAEHIEFIVNRMMDRFTYEHALNDTSDGVIITDANGTIRFANPASCDLLGYKQSIEIINK